MNTLLNKTAHELKSLLEKMDTDSFFEVKKQYEQINTVLETNPNLSDNLKNTVETNTLLGINQAQTMAIILALHTKNHGVKFFEVEEKSNNIPLITVGKSIAFWTGFNANNSKVQYAQRDDGTVFCRSYEFNGYGKAYTVWRKVDNSIIEYCKETKNLIIGFRTMSFVGLSNFKLPN